MRQIDAKIFLHIDDLDSDQKQARMTHKTSLIPLNGSNWTGILSRHSAQREDAAITRSAKEEVKTIYQCANLPRYLIILTPPRRRSLLLPAVNRGLEQYNINVSA
ncbi:MAG: hypothetical protein IPH31_16940 [Lewinellaceae bacterium]|nr:hypothetical protein [Lewinellaceae bacterium]